MGVGKSTTASALARARGVTCFDSDLDIEAVFGATGGELADSVGVDELHRIESAVLLWRLERHESSVISAAAWVVEDEQCRYALAERATVVVLQAPIDEVMRRAASGDHRRPLAAAELLALVERREPLFEAVADFTLDATQTTDQLVEQIQKLA